jgi:hypothetical protein
MDRIEKQILEQFTTIEDEFNRLDGKKGYDDFSGNIDDHEVTSFNSSCVAFIQRAVGPENAYYKQALEVVGKNSGISWNGNIPKLYGVAQSVKRDIENGYLTRTKELISAELFSDFIEMADHLLSEGYKDAAAVLLGGVLETHLKKLAKASGINLLSNAKTKRAEKLNEELGKSTYSLLEQKQVTAWLDLRNKAAHAEYDLYDTAKVDLLSQGLKNFIMAHPA